MPATHARDRRVGWDAPLTFGDRLDRKVSVVVVDGRLSREEAAELAAGR